jgi:tRNA threonylcarbamoyladenosine biosynthesis protein TsaB
MNMLAFDTCFGACSVVARWSAFETGGSLASDGAAARFERLERGHAERLAPMIEEVMADAPFAFSALGAIVVTTGPGTFTGQRVGIAAARALSLASGAPVASLSSLAVMAYTAAAEIPAEIAGKILAVAVDARRGEIYFQAFVGPDLTPLDEPALTTPEAAARMLEGRATIAVGSGADMLANADRERGGNSIAGLLGSLEPNVRFIPSASIVLGANMPQPLYLRPPDAKPQDKASLKRVS